MGRDACVSRLVVNADESADAPSHENRIATGLDRGLRSWSPRSLGHASTDGRPREAPSPPTTTISCTCQPTSSQTEKDKIKERIITTAPKMEAACLPNPRPLIPSWTATPIANLSLSAGGLLALADLNTVANRTVVAGGSSWLDALVLAPGLHYQQAADALDTTASSSAAVVAVEVEHGLERRRHLVSNAALVSFLRRLWLDAAAAGHRPLTLDVSRARHDEKGLRRRLTCRPRPSSPSSSSSSSSSSSVAGLPVDADRLSHVLYLLSPLLTSAASSFMILLGDWWGLSFILALMISRTLNIWTIKQRSRPLLVPPATKPLSPSDSDMPDRPTEYAVDLGDGRSALLLGLSSDLQALTTQSRLRPKTDLEGYLEAAAKLLVYMVAALSGNLSQAGAMVLMALLLISAGLLGLSNTRASGLRINGCVAVLRLHSAPGPSLDEDRRRVENLF
ncbi:hypothetical protein L249_0915 [Ophiocordyceps polyrhachis-furcata BCC 54312]|uniref:Uncharacterized protein n=1 Tax=Ophiocordyceps polyrhachis-furcata BCC 54312 TaxID=1330021 RepID=A0A367LEN0_9HYPO|nr:hypothetical protein L249_0915 [Ophiocordyceps polyrhachis-furcata BCC 54312]